MYNLPCQLGGYGSRVSNTLASATYIFRLDNTSSVKGYALEEVADRERLQAQERTSPPGQSSVPSTPARLALGHVVYMHEKVHPDFKDHTR